MKIIALALLLVPSFASALEHCWYGADVAAAVRKSLSEMRSEDVRALPAAAQSQALPVRHRDWEFKNCWYRRSEGRLCVYRCDDGTEYRARQSAGTVTCPQYARVRK